MAHHLEFGSELSNHEAFDSYYMSMLQHHGSPQITSITMEVDRGVGDFDILSGVLTEFFPNLRRLKLEQNYSYGPAASKADFLNFVSETKLMEFILKDFQSDFVADLAKSPTELLDYMSDGSTFKIVSGGDGDPVERVFTQGSKTLTWTDLVEGPEMGG